MTRANRFTLSVLAVAAATTLSAAENWPHWRGPGGQGRRCLPISWGPQSPSEVSSR